jgi:hypothetical protein
MFSCPNRDIIVQILLCYDIALTYREVMFFCGVAISTTTLRICITAEPYIGLWNGLSLQGNVADTC